MISISVFVSIAYMTNNHNTQNQSCVSKGCVLELSNNQKPVDTLISQGVISILENKRVEIGHTSTKKQGLNPLAKPFFTYNH